jgi:hypothetical protein
MFLRLNSGVNPRFIIRKTPSVRTMNTRLHYKNVRKHFIINYGIVYIEMYASVIAMKLYHNIHEGYK